MDLPNQAGSVQNPLREDFAKSVLGKKIHF